MQTQNQYYYLDSQEQPKGPCTAPELSRLLQEGIISSETLTSHKGASEWLPLSKVLPLTELRVHNNEPLGSSNNVYVVLRKIGGVGLSLLLGVGALGGLLYFFGVFESLNNTVNIDPKSDSFHVKEDVSADPKFDGVHGSEAVSDFSERRVVSDPRVIRLQSKLDDVLSDLVSFEKYLEGYGTKRYKDDVDGLSKYGLDLERGFYRQEKCNASLMNLKREYDESLHQDIREIYRVADFGPLFFEGRNHDMVKGQVRLIRQKIESLQSTVVDLGDGSFIGLAEKDEGFRPDKELSKLFDRWKILGFNREVAISSDYTCEVIAPNYKREGTWSRESDKVVLKIEDAVIVVPLGFKGDNFIAVHANKNLKQAWHFQRKTDKFSKALGPLSKYTVENHPFVTEGIREGIYIREDSYGWHVFRNNGNMERVHHGKLLDRGRWKVIDAITVGVIYNSWEDQLTWRDFKRLKGGEWVHVKPNNTGQIVLKLRFPEAKPAPVEGGSIGELADKNNAPKVVPPRPEIKEEIYRGGFRVWTGASGKQFEAYVANYDVVAGVIELVDQSGQSYKVEKDKIGAADLVKIRNWWYDGKKGLRKEFEYYPGLKAWFRLCPKPENGPLKDQIKRSFWIMERKFPQNHWSKIMDLASSRNKSSSSNPVVGKSVKGISLMVNEVNAFNKTQMKASIPSMSQWQYAAKAGGDDDKFGNRNIWGITDLRTSPAELCLGSHKDDHIIFVKGGNSKKVMSKEKKLNGVGFRLILH